LWNDGAAHHRERLAPGIHVLTERSLGAAPTARIDLIHQKVQQIYGPRRPEPVAWTEILRTQSEPSIEGVCVRDPSRNYGTRSSTIVYLSRRLEDTMLLHADGPPDQTAYADLSSQLRGLLEAQHGENRAMRPSS
jgi:hypothetical protein